MPTYFSATDSEYEIEAKIEAFYKQAACCTQSPPAPDAAGWGMPDWRDDSAYPAADELDDLEWRWEFLRRNHGYRLDWLRPDQEYWPCPKDRYFQQVYDLLGFFDPRLSIRSMPGFASITEPKKKTIIQWQSTGRAPFREVLLSKRYAEFWDLERIIRRPPHDVDIYVRYDLSRPIGPQADEIRSLLIGLRREIFGEDVDQVRQQRAHWPVYLRLLDAKDSGASYKQMATILRHVAGTEQSARDKLTAAEELRRRWRH